MVDDISIERYNPSDQNGVLELILSIQREEFGIDISADEQPDLMQVQTFYQKDDGDFWVARKSGVVIGTIALKDFGNGEAALRKMFVTAAWRGRDFQVARRLLESLLQHAKNRHMQRVYLGTTASFLAAHRFYEKHGFERVEQHELPSSFPLMKVDTRFYALSL